jgi:nifR3 family TIM-barrel protein
MSFQPGDVSTDSPFLLAPLAGVSDSPFRQLAREQGAAMVYTEMVSADGLARGNQATLDYCAFEPSERPIGIQIFGSDPAIMAEAARVLSDLPAAQRPDLIDINMGCPVRKVVNRCAGAALLQDVPRLSAIVERMVEVTPLPVTAKIRLGWDGQSQNVVEVARALEGAGAAAVAIHARTRAEKFEGEAHWDMIGEAKRAIGIPVIGNGDVRSPEDAAAMVAQTGCDAVMIGRTAASNPWIFRQIEQYTLTGRYDLPTEADRYDMIRTYFAMLVEERMPGAAGKMKQFASWFTHGVAHGAHLRKSVYEAKSETEILDAVDRFFEQLLDGKIAAHVAPATVETEIASLT